MSKDWTQQNIDLFKEIAERDLDKFISNICNNKTETEVFEFKYKKEIIELFFSIVIKTEFEIYMNDKSKNIERNGSYDKSVNTEIGEVNVSVPRDKASEFKATSIPRYSRTTDELARMITHLLEAGLSSKLISSFLEKTYSYSYSSSTICKYGDAILEVVGDYNTRRLDKRYVALFMDATYIPIKFNNKFEKQALHLVVAINDQGYQEIIGYIIGHKENNQLWADVLDNMKERGVEKIDIAITDGFVGIQQIIKSRFPHSAIQRCVVHIQFNIRAKILDVDKVAMKAEMRNLFTMTSLEAFNSQLEVIINKYPQYEQMLRKTFEDDSITTYLEFPVGVQKTFRSNNRIESVNQKIKTRVRSRQSFQSIESFEKVLISSIINQNNNSDKLVHGMEEYLKQ